MTAKVNNAMVLEAIKEMRQASKARKFTQSVEIQLGLKDYDPQKDKRFVGTVRLPNIPRPNLKICMIADEKHKTEAKKDDLDIAITTTARTDDEGRALLRAFNFPLKG